MRRTYRSLLPAALILLCGLLASCLSSGPEKPLDAMADAIYGFIKYPALSKMFAKKGLEEVTGLKWNNAAAKIKSVYEDVINESRK